MTIASAPNRAADSHPRVAVWLLALLTAGLLVALSYPVSASNDEGLWMYMGRIWADHGLAPYRHAIENKTPGIFLLYGLSERVFGTSLLPLRLLGVLAIVVGGVVAGRIASRLVGASQGGASLASASLGLSSLAGLVAQAVYGLTMGWRLLDGRSPAQTETFMVLCSALSLWTLVRACAGPDVAGADGAAIDRRLAQSLFLSALWLGAAIGFKQVAVCTAAGWMIYYGLNCGRAQQPGQLRRLLQGAVLLAAGIATATLISWLPLAWSGVTVADYWHGAWTILFDTYSSRTLNFAADDPGVAWSTGLAAQRAGFIETWLQSRLRYFLPLLILIAVRRQLLADRRLLGVLGWGAMDFVGANASGYYFGHQLKQVMLALAVVAGVVVVDALGRLLHRIPQAVYAVLLVLIGLCLPYEELDRAGEEWREWRDGLPETARQLGDWIDQRAPPDASVWCADLGCNSVLAYSGRVAPGRYFNVLFLSRPGAVDETLAALAERPPAYVVKHRGWRSLPVPIKEYLGANYRLSFTRRGYTVLEPR